MEPASRTPPSPLSGTRILLAGILLLTGCTGPAPPEPAAPSPAREATASPRPTPYFPTRPGAGGPDVGLQGVLAVRDNCVVIEGDAGVDILVLWPDVVGIEVENGVVRLVDEDGRVIASEGDRLSINGGEAQPQAFREYAGEPPPACPDELWWGGLPIERLG